MAIIEYSFYTKRWADKFRRRILAADNEEIRIVGQRVDTAIDPEYSQVYSRTVVLVEDKSKKKDKLLSRECEFNPDCEWITAGYVIDTEYDNYILN